MTTDTLMIEGEAKYRDAVSRESASIGDTKEIAPQTEQLCDLGIEYPITFQPERTSEQLSRDVMFPCSENTEGFTLSQLCRDLIELTKPRIVVMILITTLATAFIGAGQPVQLIDLFLLLIGTGLVAASAGAANQIWEREIDGKMSRTAKRPISSGRLHWFHGSLYAGSLGILGCGLILTEFGLAPAAVGASTWLLYVLFYTPMKTRTSWNTTLGAVAGALPMLIGYTATGGQLTELTGWLLFGILAAWQYPHFMAIAWMYREQYEQAGFKMSTTVDPSGRSAGIQSVSGSLVLIVCAVGLCWMRSNLMGAIFSTLLTLLFAWPMLNASIRFAACPNDQIARSLLRRSLLVLPLVLAVVTATLLW